MQFLFDVTDTRTPATRPKPAPRDAVVDRSFPTRVAALLRSRPIADLATNARHQDWPADTYDVPTLALAAIDLVIAQQGLEFEATYADVVTALTSLAAKAALDRPAPEHAKVARYAVDGLLNRAERETPFTYRISDYTGEDGHLQRQVQFRLLVEREDPVRGEVVLNATGDAINALVGGLEFEVEDEQVANEILLERQLARGAFEAAERAAIRARLPSVGLADRFTALTKATRRDLKSVVQAWADDVPAALDAAREHIRGRVDVEHRLLVKVRETVVSDDDAVAAASARIDALLSESRRRHELLHRHVMQARAVFLDEQDRQAFRAPAPAHLPDLVGEVLHPLVELPVATATDVTWRFLLDMAGPRAPRLPRLYRVVHDLWAAPAEDDDDRDALEAEELDAAEAPWIRPEVVAAAARAVETVGLPARLSTLIAACLHDDEAADDDDRRQAAEVTALAALWCFADDTPTTADDDGAAAVEAPRRRADLAVTVFGPRVAVDADDAVLRLPGWSGDDLVVAPDPDALATADPQPTLTTDRPPLGARTC